MSKTDISIRALAGGAAVVAGSVGAASAQDVAGFYGGVSLSMPMGDFDTLFGLDYSFEGDTAGGFFAGYNFVNGNMVYGGEIAMSSPYRGFNYGIEGLENMIDLKAKVGTVMGSTLVYGTLGYSMADVDTVPYLAANGSADASGFNIGVGFETPLGTGNGFIGGEVLHRNMSTDGTFYGNPASVYMDSINLTTVSVRLGFRF